MSRSLTGGRPAREKEINEIRKSTDCTTGKMIFTKLRDKNVALLVNSGGIAAVRVLRSNASKLGGIYLGKIQNVAKNIDACFVEIAPGELCFLPLREAGTAHLTNRQPDGSLKAGDELAIQVAQKFGDYRGKGLGIIAGVLDPEIFVIGGGVSKAGEVLFEYIRPSYEKTVFHACRNTEFALATLGNDAGIYGAAKMVLD